MICRYRTTQGSNSRPHPSNLISFQRSYRRS